MIQIDHHRSPSIVIHLINSRQWSITVLRSIYNNIRHCSNCNNHQHNSHRHHHPVWSNRHYFFRFLISYKMRLQLLLLFRWSISHHRHHRHHHHHRQHHHHHRLYHHCRFSSVGCLVVVLAPVPIDIILHHVSICLCRQYRHIIAQYSNRNLQWASTNVYCVSIRTIASRAHRSVLNSYLHLNENFNRNNICRLPNAPNSVHRYIWPKHKSKYGFR